MDDLRTHYNREIHENNTFKAKVKAIWNMFSPITVMIVASK